jgi:predicted transcriptional regulator
MQALPDDVGLAYNTVLTTMRILERKGYLAHEKHGRAHTYRPLLSRNQAQNKAVRHMVRSMFNDSPQLLLLNVLESEELSSEELARLQQMLKAKE